MFQYFAINCNLGLLTSPSLVIRILAHVFLHTDFWLLNIVAAYKLVYSSGLCSWVNRVLKRLSKLPWRYWRPRCVVAFLVLSAILALIPHLLLSVTSSTLILWCKWCMFVDTWFIDLLDIIATSSTWLNVSSAASTSLCTCLEAVLILGTWIRHILRPSSSLPSLSKCWWSRAFIPWWLWVDDSACLNFSDVGSHFFC